MSSSDLNNLKLLYLSLYVLSNQPEIETDWDRREIETNLQSQSQVFDSNFTTKLTSTRVAS